MDNSVRGAQTASVAVVEISNPSNVSNTAALKEIDVLLTKVFSEWKQSLSPGDRKKYELAHSVQTIHLENCDTGVCALKNQDKIRAYGRILLGDSKALFDLPTKDQVSQDAAIQKAFASLKGYFEGDCLLNKFPAGSPLAGRLIRNYASPDEAMRKLIDTCRVRDIFATEDKTFVIHMEDVSKMTPELLARCIMTDVEYKFFECDKLFRDLDAISGYIVEGEPPECEIKGLAGRNGEGAEQCKALVGAIIEKFRDPNSGIQTVLEAHYSGIPIGPAILRYFTEAAQHANIEIQTQEIPVFPCPHHNQHG